MAFDKKKYAKAYEKHRMGGDFWNPDAGETRVLVHSPCRGDADTYEPTDGTNFVPIAVHYKVGGKMVVCLDAEKNPIIRHPFVVEFLKKRGIKLDSDECPVCREIYDGGLDEEAAADARFQMKFLWGVTPIDYKKSAADDAMVLKPRPGVLLCGKTVYEGIIKVILEEGDITNLDEAVLVKIGKEGKGLNTKYAVVADTRTLRKPLKASKALRRAVLASLKVEGDCDLFKLAANLVKSHSEVKAALSGIRVEESDVETSGGGDEPPSCFGLDYDPGDDDECGKCGHREACAEKKAKLGGGTETESEETPEEGGEETSEETPEGGGEETLEKGAEGGEEAGEEAGEGEGEEAGGDDEPDPECFGIQCEDDDDCGQCDCRVRCAEKCDVDVPWRPKPKKKPAKKGKTKKGKTKKPDTSSGSGEDLSAEKKRELDDLEAELEMMGQKGSKGKGK